MSVMSVFSSATGKRLVRFTECVSGLACNPSAFFKIPASSFFVHFVPIGVESWSNVIRFPAAFRALSVLNSFLVLFFGLRHSWCPCVFAFFSRFLVFYYSLTWHFDFLLFTRLVFFDFAFVSFSLSFFNLLIFFAFGEPWKSVMFWVLGRYKTEEGAFRSMPWGAGHGHKTHRFSLNTLGCRFIFPFNGWRNVWAFFDAKA